MFLSTFITCLLALDFPIENSLATIPQTCCTLGMGPIARSCKRLRWLIMQTRSLLELLKSSCWVLVYPRIFQPKTASISI